MCCWNKNYEPMLPINNIEFYIKPHLPSTHYRPIHVNYLNLPKEAPSIKTVSVIPVQPEEDTNSFASPQERK